MLGPTGVLNLKMGYLPKSQCSGFTMQLTLETAKPPVGIFFKGFIQDSFLWAQTLSVFPV